MSERGLRRRFGCGNNRHRKDGKITAMEKNANMEVGSWVKTTKTTSRSDLFQLGFKRSNTHSIRSKRSDRRFVLGDDLKFAR